MFIDVCFPNKNEEKFIEIAKKLKTESLCFVYGSPSKACKVENKEIKIYYGFLSGKTAGSACFSSDFPKGVSSAKNTVFFIKEFENSKKSFFTPLPLINQVLIKEVASKDNAIGFGLPLLLNSKMHPKKIDQVRFLIGLCKKYKVNIIIGSFAYSPYDLRSEKELFNLFCKVFRNPGFIKNSFNTLPAFFDNSF